MFQDVDSKDWNLVLNWHGTSSAISTEAVPQCQKSTRATCVNVLSTMLLHRGTCLVDFNLETWHQETCLATFNLDFNLWNKRRWTPRLDVLDVRCALEDAINVGHVCCVCNGVWAISRLQVYLGDLLSDRNRLGQTYPPLSIEHILLAYTGLQEQEVKFQDRIFCKFQDLFVSFARLKTQ